MSDGDYLKASKCYLSVIVITYNHEKYIQKCLDSILMQEINFDIEIIIGDDFSNDNTPNIIRDYYKKFPDIIRPHIRSHNLGATKNQYKCFLEAKGKYIAILDGDDFWTDRNKLKSQVNFLDKNSNYIGSSQRYSIVDQDNKIIKTIYKGPGSPESGDYKLDHFLNYIYYGHPGTLVFRNIFLKPKHDYSIIYKADRFVGDITLCMILVCLGIIHVSNDNMTSYRKVIFKDGTSYQSSIKRKSQILKRINFLKKLESYCQLEMNLDIKHRDRSLYYLWWSILFMLRYPSRYNLSTLKQVFRLTDNKWRLPVYIIMKLPELFFRLLKLAKKKLGFV